MKPSARGNRALIVVAILVAGIFVLDWIIPLDDAVWLGYVFPVILVAWTNPRRYAYLVTALCTLLIGLIYFVAPFERESSLELVNRGMAAVALWIVVVVNCRLRGAQEALRQAHDRLELRVQERTAELAKTNRELQTEIQERIRTEAALRASEERYRTLVEMAPDAVAVHRDGRFLYANTAALQLYGVESLQQLQ